MSHKTYLLLSDSEFSLRRKKIPNKNPNKIKKNNECIHICVICAESATRIDTFGKFQTKFINCKLQYLTDGNQKRHRDNDKAICLTCCNKLKEQQREHRCDKNNHCPFCRSHNPLAKPTVLIRMPKKKKNFADAYSSRINKLNIEFIKELREKNRDEVMINIKFSPLFKYKKKEETKRNNAIILRNKIRLPKRRS